MGRVIAYEAGVPGSIPDTCYICHRSLPNELTLKGIKMYRIKFALAMLPAAITDLNKHCLRTQISKG